MDPERVYLHVPETHAVFLASLYETIKLEDGIPPHTIGTPLDRTVARHRRAFDRAINDLLLEERIRISVGYLDRRTPAAENPLLLSEHVPPQMHGFWPLYRTVERTGSNKNPEPEGITRLLAYAGETLKNGNRPQRVWESQESSSTSQPSEGRTTMHATNAYGNCSKS